MHIREVKLTFGIVLSDGLEDIESDCCSIFEFHLVSSIKATFQSGMSKSSVNSRLNMSISSPDIWGIISINKIRA